MNQSDFLVHVEKEVTKLTLHNVPDRPGIAAEIFQHLSQGGMNVDLVVQTAGGGEVTDISLVIVTENFLRASEALNNLKKEIGFSKISTDDGIALLILSRKEMSKIHGTAARMFRTLAECNVNIGIISTSLDSIACLIDIQNADIASKALHEEFLVTPIS